MLKYFCFSLIVILFAEANVDSSSQEVDINPHGIEDEVRQQLEELRNSITGRIFVAIDEIDLSSRNARIFSANLRKASEITMGQSYQKVEMELRTWSDLAEQDNVDISQCWEFFNTVFSQLLTTSVASFPECLNPYTTDIETGRDTSVYKIDTAINDVHVLDFQIDRCAGNVICLAPLTAQIELAHVRIPQTIGTEVINLQADYDISKVTVQQCMWGKAAHYEEQATQLFNTITECINNSWT